MSTHVQVCVSALLSIGDKCAVTYKGGKNGGGNLEVMEVTEMHLLTLTLTLNPIHRAPGKP